MSFMPRFHYERLMAMLVVLDVYRKPSETAQHFTARWLRLKMPFDIKRHSVGINPWLIVIAKFIAPIFVANASP